MERKILVIQNQRIKYQNCTIDSKKSTDIDELKSLLREFRIRVNHKKILRLMKKINIKSVIRKKKFKYKKT